jgi:carbonic anhydrase
MTTLPARAFLVAILATLPAMAQSAPNPVPLNIDRRAALIEVLPPESIQKSPAATDLVNRLIKKHVLLLQHPALITQVLQNPDVKHERWVADKKEGAVEKLTAAIRVRTIPDTNIIEVMVDPAAAGDESAMLAEAIVNQHLENQKRLTENKQLERSVMLNNLKQRYQFRKDELGRDLREKAVQLSVDGMGTPGRLSAKEVELQKLIELRFDLERKKLDASGDKAVIDAQLKQVQERVDAAKADLGALTNAMNQYLTIKDDEQTTRGLLRQVNDQLEQIQQMSNATSLEVQWLCHPSRN